MTILVAYTQSGFFDEAVPSAYSYEVTVPGLSAGAAMCRLLLQGNVALASVYAGSTFTGEQKPVTVNGQSTFTLTSSGVLTDAIPLALTQGGSLVLRYDAQGTTGKAYKRKSGLASGFIQRWKTGARGAANGNNALESGYTTVTGYAVVIGRIDVGGAEDFAPAPPPAAELEDDKMSYMLEGRVIAAGANVDGVAQKHVYFGLQNPSGKRLVIEDFKITPDQDTVMEVFRLDLANALTGPTAMPKCNLLFGAGGGTGYAFYALSDSLVGNRHAIYKLKGGEPFNLKPLIGMNPGASPVWTVGFALHTKGAGATASIEWIEMDA